MKIFVIKYHSVSESMFSTPHFTHEEYVEADSIEKVIEYAKEQTDQFGHKFNKESAFEYTLISNCGGVIIKEIQIKTL